MPKMSFISSTVYTRFSYVVRGGAVLLPPPVLYLSQCAIIRIPFKGLF